MDNVNISSHLALATAAVVLAAAIGVFRWISGSKPRQPRAETSATSEKAGTAAGARVTPTEPKLRVEPK